VRRFFPFAQVRELSSRTQYYFQSPDRSAMIAIIYIGCCLGVDGCQYFVKLIETYLVTNRFEITPQLIIWSMGWNLPILQDRTDIRPSSPLEDWQLPSEVNFFNKGSS